MTGAPTQDFWPGEYQRNYTMVRNGGRQAAAAGDRRRPARRQHLRVVSGQIIDRLGFVVCTGKTAEALVAQIAANAAIANIIARCGQAARRWARSSWCDSGTDLVVGVAVRDPAGTNYSPYTFPNPSLLQVGINQPMNAPVLDHIDLISGLVTGYRTPGHAGLLG